MSLKAPITNISRGSLHDGEGVRTVVYFKGCTLRCAWCHNPETLSLRNEILYAAQKCIHCGKCVEICPEHHKISGNDMLFERSGCTLCGKCVENCPSLALSFCSEDKTVDEVFDEIKKDFHYYKASNGGVTFSGGECLLYPDFVAELAKKCCDNGIHTAVESAFFVPFENVLKVLPYVDFFFADLKIPDSEKHARFTGQRNELIIENITKLSNMHKSVTVRIPVIPGVNDSAEDVDGFASIISALGEGVLGVELLRYNNLARSKYDIVGKEYTEFSETPQTDERMKNLAESLFEKCRKHCYFV